MPHPKRQSSSNRKRITERQIILARRSRSIKSSLLKALSLDLVTLYQAGQAKDSVNPTAQNSSHSMPHQFSDCHNPPELYQTSHSTPSNFGIPLRPAKQQVAQFDEMDSRQVQETNHHADKVVPRPANEKAFATIMVRCFVFLLGVLIRCFLIFYLQPFAILLSGFTIAISGISLLMVVVFTPWKKKLLWNLACLFGGLLVAVLVL